MSTKLAYALLFLSLASLSAFADVVTFQQGVSGYIGTSDVEFKASASTTALPNALEISIDESDGGFPNQGALRFGNIFTNEGGPIPLNEEILYAELEFIVTSETDSDAIISFNRVLGPDQNRRSGSGAWTENDSWNSLGGDNTAEGDPPVLEEKPIEVGPSSVLGVGNEAIEAPESFDTSGQPRGVLPQELNTANINDILNGTDITVDVTDSIIAWQSGAPNHGWAINNTTGGGWDFLSSEWSVASHPPEDQPDAQFLLSELGRTEEQVRPLLRVVFGVSGDVDGDTNITPNDYNLLRGALGNVYDSRGETGDLDFDRDADLEDFARFKVAFDESHGAGAFAALVAGVPEPSTIVLVAMTAGLFCGHRLRRPRVAVNHLPNYPPSTRPHWLYEAQHISSH